MKQKTPSTFILNAEDKKFFFVEGKISPLYGPVYHVYYDAKEKPAFYTANNFIEEHGTNSKIPVMDFVRRANFALTPLQNTNIKINEAYNTFNDVYLKIKSNGLKKSIKKNRVNLINAISIYNDVRHLLPSDPDISYEEDYEYIKSLEKSEAMKNVASKKSERKAVKRIEEAQINIKGKQRILKKVSQV